MRHIRNINAEKYKRAYRQGDVKKKNMYSLRKTYEAERMRSD